MSPGLTGVFVGEPEFSQNKVEASSSTEGVESAHLRTHCQASFIVDTDWNNHTSLTQKNTINPSGQRVLQMTGL